tara:strand:- start:528 stop:701 length:174 start_codon:yes stop_codon:yes gene_type:complete
MGNFLSIKNSKELDDINVKNLILENYNLKSDNEALHSQVKSLKKIIIEEGQVESKDS